MIISRHQSRNCTSSKKLLAVLTCRWKNCIYSLAPGCDGLIDQVHLPPSLLLSVCTTKLFQSDQLLVQAGLGGEQGSHVQDDGNVVVLALDLRELVLEVAHVETEGEGTAEPDI